MPYFRIHPDIAMYKWFFELVVFASLLVSTNANTALLIIDVQNCFLPGGSLPVTDGNDVIPVINNIRQKYKNEFTLTVLSQDWHCKDHVSFASQHPGNQPFDVIGLQYDNNGTLCVNDSSICNGVHSLNQTLWPDHCVINSTSAEFSTQLQRENADIVIRKGYHCDIDSYSAFFDNGGFSKTNLEHILRANNIRRVVVTGLALDFCVYYTSKDAQKLGLEVFTVVDASRPVDQNNVPRVLKDLQSSGVHVVPSSKLDVLVSSSTELYSSIFTFLVLLLCAFCVP